MRFLLYHSVTFPKSYSMQKHQWRENTDEGTRFYRAFYHASRWDFASQLKGEYEWEENYKPTQEVWQSLRDILWAKYIRKRCTWKIIQTVDKVLKNEYGVQPPQES